ncbi:hypothetical protein [Haloarchaeobius sp. DFWS5]|uniref:hypothetical protein n=1 Tax=Haloarchaeobius sp. DFWS5 TaxID=3446114 RepID=UPI003EB86D38
MRIRDWEDIVTDVVESSADPEGWRAVAGDRANGLGEDLYLGHPNSGVYHLKTYARNPYEVRGVGSRVARRLDDEIGRLFPEQREASRFAVQSPPEDEDHATDMAKRLEEVVKAHADAPTTPGDLFDDMMDALESPAFGPMEYDQYDRPDRLDDLATTFEEAEELLDAELDDLVSEDGVDRGFM